MERLENKLRKAEREKEELATELRMTKEKMQKQVHVYYLRLSITRDL